MSCKEIREEVDSIDLTRMECKDFEKEYKDMMSFGIDLTRMECKAFNSSEIYATKTSIDLTRMECKVTCHSSSFPGCLV